MVVTRVVFPLVHELSSFFFWEWNRLSTGFRGFGTAGLWVFCLIRVNCPRFCAALIRVGTLG